MVKRQVTYKRPSVSCLIKSCSEINEKRRIFVTKMKIPPKTLCINKKISFHALVRWQHFSYGLLVNDFKYVGKHYPLFNKDSRTVCEGTKRLHFQGPWWHKRNSKDKYYVQRFQPPNHLSRIACLFSINNTINRSLWLKPELSIEECIAKYFALIRRIKTDDKRYEWAFPEDAYYCMDIYIYGDIKINTELWRPKNTRYFDTGREIQKKHNININLRLKDLYLLSKVYIKVVYRFGLYLFVVIVIQILYGGISEITLCYNLYFFIY